MPESEPPDGVPLEPAAGEGSAGGSANAGPVPGTEALQAAALQAIAAAKVFLDLAEQAVRDPAVLGQVTSSLSAVAKGVLGALAPTSAASRPGDGTGRDADGTTFEHIDVG